MTSKLKPVKDWNEVITIQVSENGIEIAIKKIVIHDPRAINTIIQKLENARDAYAFLKSTK